MNIEPSYKENSASEVQIAEHLMHCDAGFKETLSNLVEIEDYINKIYNNATRFEAWADNILIGLVAVYCNNHVTHIAHITNVSVIARCTGIGIATKLMTQCVKHAKKVNMQQISLQVAAHNTTAIDLYKKMGFVVGRSNEAFIAMTLNLQSEQA